MESIYNKSGTLVFVLVKQGFGAQGMISSLLPYWSQLHHSLHIQTAHSRDSAISALKEAHGPQRTLKCPGPYPCTGATTWELVNSLHHHLWQKKILNEYNGYTSTYKKIFLQAFCSLYF